MEINQYRESFDKEIFYISTKCHVHTICALFKLFLRELPQPVMPYDL